MKFTLAFITVGLIPLMVLSYLSIATVSNQVERHTISNYEEILDYSSTRLDDLYEKYNYITKLMYTYNLPEFGRVNDVINEDDHLSSYQTERAIDDFLRTLLNTDQYIKNVVLIPSYDGIPRYHSRYANQFIRANYTLHEEYGELIKDNLNLLTILPVHKDDYFADTEGYVLTFSRNLLDNSAIITPNTTVLGTIFIDVDLQAIGDIFDDLNMQQSDEVYVLNEKNNIVYSNRTEKIGERFTGIQEEGAEGSTQLEKNVPSLGWRILTNIEKQTLFERLSSTLTIFHVVILGCILSLIGVALFFSKKFSRPIAKMTELMKKVESGNMNERMNIDRSDELGLLANGFDHMLDHLNDYIKEVYLAQINQKQAELNALRSQIQPHYLYNTLEVIRMSAVDQDADNVAEMIHYLSKQLKYIMEHDEDTVELKRELNYVQAYLNLMEYRYEDQIQYEIKVDDHLLKNQMVPKLTIQPIIENSIKHGLLEKRTSGRIELNVEKEDQHCMITIFDDGIGMQPSRLSALQAYIHDNGPIIESSGSGIGLKNVHTRIKELYGEEYGLEIQSKENVGTMVIVRLPILEVEKCTAS